MPSVKVGVDEFREHLAKYLDSPTPVTITRNGETVGTYTPARRLPARPKPTQEDLDRLSRLGNEIQAWMASAGVTEDELVEDFERLRRESRKSRV